MPADDIYSVVTQYELPSGSASHKVHVEQNVNNTQVDNSNMILSEAWDAHFGSTFIDMLSDDCWIAGIQVTKLTGNPEASFRLDNTSQVGTRTGPSLPNNNALQMRIKQNTLNGKHDGRIYLPGVAEPDTNIGVLKAAFAATQMGAFVLALSTQIVETSGGTGRWSVGVINQTILNAAGPGNPKDWEGAYAVSTGITGHVIIATQRRRQTKITHTAI